MQLYMLHIGVSVLPWMTYCNGLNEKKHYLDQVIVKSIKARSIHFAKLLCDSKVLCLECDSLSAAISTVFKYEIHPARLLHFRVDSIWKMSEWKAHVGPSHFGKIRKEMWSRFSIARQDSTSSR